MSNVTRREFMAASAAVAAAATVARSGGGVVAESLFMAGLAVSDITPPTGVPMWGYSDRKGPSTGTLDPLHARALVLKSGTECIAIVTMDLGRVPPPPLLDKIRKAVKGAGVSHVTFTASHTHGGPVMELPDAPHVQEIAERLKVCIIEAAGSMQPVAMGIGSALFDVSHNRRVITKDGRCEMLWRNENKIPTSPVDRQATLIKLDTADGKPFATLVHFACHPVVLAGDNLEYTADYVGEMCRLVKAATGAECLFLQGGCGDINPYLDKTPRDKGGVEAMRGVGKECADAVLAALPNIATAVPESPSLAYSEKAVEVGTRWDFQDEKQQEVFRAVYSRMFEVYLKELKPDLKVPLAVLVIHGELALAFMPGELFTQHQLDLKMQSPLWPETPEGGGSNSHELAHRRKALLVGYSNDFQLYFPTIKDAAAGGYGGVAATYVGLGAGEKLVMEAQIEIGKSIGSLKDFCAPEPESQGETKMLLNRRAFLATTGVAFAATHARAAATDRIRVAIIGLHNRGPQVAESLIECGQFDIAALCDCDTAMFDEGMKALDAKLSSKPKLESDYRRVYDDPDIDAVVIATPDHSHALLACQALDAGKHVYLEKPASYNIRDGQLMVAAQQKRSDHVVAVGTQQRSGAHFVEAKQFIDGGGLGRIAFARAWISHRRDTVEKVADSEPPATLNYDMWLGPAPQRPYNVNRVHYNWRFIRDYGTGEMGNWGAHWIDTVRWLANLDLPSAAAGAGGTFVVNDAKEWPDTQTVIYQYPNFTLLWELRLWTKYGVNGMGGGAEIGGDKGTIIINRKGWEFFPADGLPQKHGGSELEVAHAKNFADAIQGKAKPAIDIVEGHKTATVCHLGNISVALNRRIEFDATTESFPGDADAKALAAREYRAPWKLE